MASLVSMDAATFRTHMKRTIVNYAQDHVRDGSWAKAESLAKSKKEVEALLPDGLRTEGHFFFSILAGPSNHPVGGLWLCIHPSHGKGVGFIYDLYIDRVHRRKGYAGEAMRALELFAKRQGLKSLRLHVFAHNPHAIALYRKLGYAETNLVMAKSLP